MKEPLERPPKKKLGHPKSSTADLPVDENVVDLDLHGEHGPHGVQAGLDQSVHVAELDEYHHL